MNANKHLIIRSPNRGLLEVLQLDFVPKDISDQAESQSVSWRLELPGNTRDVGVMRIFTTQRDYVGLAPLVMVGTISVTHCFPYCAIQILYAV